MLLLGGCASGKLEKTDDAATEPKTETEAEAETKAELSGEFSFDDLNNLEFFLGNNTDFFNKVYIRADGSFCGVYHDHIEWPKGPYSGGMLYISEYSGQFTQPERINDYTYSVKIEELNYKDEPGKEEVIDDTLYHYSAVYGLVNTENILIYLPGAPLSEMSEAFRNYVGYKDISDTEKGELPFYALNNEEEQIGFRSVDFVEKLRARVASAEEQAEVLEYSITNDPLTQSELNGKTKEIYELWDGTLNEVWYYLKLIKSDEEMKPILAEQREWIAGKEREAEAAGKDFEGGTMQPMIINNKAAEMTKERVYELMKLFGKEGE